jgi:uncharacterized protein YegL
MADKPLNEHLVVSMIIDNSYVAQSQSFCDGLKTFTNELGSFYQSHPHKDRFHLSLTTFGGLEPFRLKSFDDDTFQAYECEGFPLLNVALEQSLNDLSSKLSQLQSANEEIYKPWLIILSSGISYESLSLLSNDSSLKLMSQTTYFPFLLDDKFLANQVSAMNRLKPFMVIKDHQINALFNWLSTMINDRLKDHSEVKMKLDKEMLKDWIYL